MTGPELARGSRDRRPSIAVALIALSLVVVIAAERDVHRRPNSQIRGPKLIWRLANLNAVGALGYLVWGRTQDRSLSPQK
jgi:hypothetical protein